MEASATIAMITEPQQTVWLRHLPLKCVEESDGEEAIRTLMKSHGWFAQPLTRDTHQHISRWYMTYDQS